MFGFLNIHKPPGPTSHDIVAAVRRRTGRDVKVGHAGTLDPFAEGVLVVCLGGACRLAEYVQEGAKGYHAEVRLGEVSETDDTQGPITPFAQPGQEAASPPSIERVREAISRFVGTIQQVPPAHSAVHVAGQRAYKLARRGEAMDLAPREVRVHAISLLRYDWPALEIEVQCGSGTYIRSLARDIGLSLGVGGYCRRLIRTRVGSFVLEQAKSVEQFSLPADMVDPLAALAGGRLPSVQVDASTAARVAGGNAFELTQLIPAAEILVVGPDGVLIAVARTDPTGRIARPVKVLMQ